MINKYEAVGIFASIAMMTLALFLLRVDTSPELAALTNTGSQVAAVAVVDETNENGQEALFGAIVDSLDEQGSLGKMIIDDVVLGSGAEAQKGDTVSVHYIGTLQSGQQFDNSYTRGEAFSFVLGENRVIEGWEEGVLGMKAGGERILVIPPEKAYGSRNVGPIPANSTLVFAIKLLEIN